MKVLDKGFVEVVDHMGDDLRVVNAARVSFGKKKSELTESDLRLLSFLAKHKHFSPFRHLMVSFHMKAPEFVMRQCYSADTEVLTEQGWKFWGEVTRGDKLAAVSQDGTYHFEKPSDLIKRPYLGEMIQGESQGLSFLVTPDHRMWVSRRYKTSKINTFRPFGYVQAGDLSGELRTSPLPSQELDEGTEGEEWYGKFLGMFLGDGSCCSSPNRITFNVKKKRKVDYLDSLLSYLNFGGKKVLRTASGYAVYHFDNPDKGLFCGKSTAKRINFARAPHTRRFFLGLFDGLMNSDGTASFANKTAQSWRYSSTSQGLLLDIKKLCDILGYRAHNSGHTYLNIGRNRSRHILQKYLSRVSYDGMVYCASVSTGLLLVRRSDKPMVCGNCYKHVVGIETTSSYPTKDHAWSEVSQRYIPVTDYYLPYNYRTAPENKKQGSGPNLPEEMNMLCQEEAEMFMAKAFNLYDWMINSGVAPEQARIYLPLNIYTEVYWTASFQAIANFLELRDAPDAQWEIQEYARAIRALVVPLFPETMKAWFGEEGGGVENQS